ncbi:unnamed protein product [Rotaria socialis]|uniref:Uncharacterized protein n=1 Tax=Rotaria socialis TaxID=392032 RepID=A0A821E7N6_9BILA|nr:unnamed protein product [Rotaria socialis]CAF3409248.1 unnamed protein product [Rotaria socialis]CAF3720386.1 unnamed protein product [Rotaria socialis]CAF4445478.1 unnamed protein product [Rotaria socialis]CAF4626329.1 unnamed protein product [Rotaria socialis]
MVANLCLVLLLALLFCAITNALPPKRYRRQTGDFAKEDLPYGGWGGGSSNPSGAIPGAYYGTGINPNYGDFGPNRNDADSSIHTLNYNQGYSYNSGFVPQWNPHQSEQNEHWYNLPNNNYNNPLQRPYSNSNNNRPYNRYPPGSQGWYATGGNYWYNKGQYSIPHIWLLISSILMSIICYYCPVVHHKKDDLPYGGSGGGSSNPSGAIPGAYYGTGINPNYGDFGPNRNDADGSINTLNYNQGYSYNSGLVPQWNPQQSEQNEHWYNLPNNNYNNPLQRPYSNSNNNRSYNCYPSGSQGWYVTGRDYWYNKGQYSIPHIWLLISSILMSIICK